MRRTCTAICAAVVLGGGTPEVGVAQGPLTPSVVQLSDTLGASDSVEYKSERHRSESEGMDFPESHSAEAVSYENDPQAAVVPYGPGERLEYKVKAGIFNAGEAHMEVLGIDSVRGEPAYHVELDIRGGIIWGALKAESHFESWIDTQRIISRSFISDVSNTGHSSYRSFEFYPDEMYWEQTDEGVIGELGTALPLDDLSFIYFVRSLPLEVGQTYTYSRYFKKDGNPVIIEVVRRDVRETPAGTFNTIVVRPTIKTSGLYKEGGEAELHFSDDENRYLVYMRVGMAIVGSITMHLESIVPGTPLNSGPPTW